MLKHPPCTHVHFDQLHFTAKVDHDILHTVLADAFGAGTPIRREVNGRKQVGMVFSGTEIWASYMNPYGYCWLAMPGTKEYLSILGLLAHFNKIRFRLLRVELAFDLPCSDATYAQAETMLYRLVYRMSRVNNYSAEFVRNFSDEFKQCKDGTVNGKKTFYIQTINKHKYEKSGKKVPGNYISSKTKIYCKQIDNVWNIRIELTMFKDMARVKIPYLLREYERIIELCNTVDFYDFWRLFDVDYAAFKTKARELLCKNNKKPVYVNMLFSKKSNSFFLEQRAHMKKVAKRIGLKESIQQFFREMTIEEALSSPLPDEIGHE